MATSTFHTSPNLELVLLDHSTLHVVPDLPQHCQHGNVSLPGTGRCRDQQILTGTVSCIEDNGLNAVERPCSLEGQLHDIIEVFDPHFFLSDGRGRGTRVGDVDLFHHPVAFSFGCLRNSNLRGGGGGGGGREGGREGGEGGGEGEKA